MKKPKKPKNPSTCTQRVEIGSLTLGKLKEMMADSRFDDFCLVLLPNHECSDYEICLRGAISYSDEDKKELERQYELAMDQYKQDLKTYYLFKSEEL